ncbi:MAG: hypothetical protein OES23_08500, partial [Nitrosopumilus sp.]|nr:hypothetical protein [Nitrosopumilus sp.]
VRKTIRLQHREYAGSDGIVKYTQHRINIPHHIVHRLNWNNENHIVLNINLKKKILTLDLETKNQR